MTKLLFILLLSITILNPAYGKDGKAIFTGECFACHNIGGGRKVGPDLEGVTKRRDLNWLLKFINNSAELIASGDPQAKKVFEEYGKMPMPPHSFTKEEIASLADYINVSKTGGAPAPSTQNESAAAVADPETGKILFTGQKRLENGGPSCASCHNVRVDSVFSGGSFAKDLSDSDFDAEGATVSPTAALPAMKCSFENQGVTPAERSHLQAFLKKVRAEHVYSYPRSLDGFLLFWGSILATLLLLFSKFSRMNFTNRRS